MKPITWQQRDMRFEVIQRAFVGRIHVATVKYTLRNRNEPESYTYLMTLPGFKHQTGQAPTEKECMAIVERNLKDWFKETE